MKIPEKALPVLIGIFVMILIWWGVMGFSLAGFLFFCFIVGFLWIFNKTNIFYPHTKDDE